MEEFDKSDKEKRTHPRLHVSFTVLYTVKAPFMVRIRIGNNDCTAMAHDIGVGGMALLTKYQIPVDSLLELKFTIINEAILDSQYRKRDFDLDGQVCYCEAAGDENYRLGVCFLNILPSEMMFIADYIKANALLRNTDPVDQ